MDEVGASLPDARVRTTPTTDRNAREAIDAALDTGLSQGLVESTNTKIRVLTRIAFAFHGYQPLVALAMLALGSNPPPRPQRTRGNNRRAT